MSQAKLQVAIVDYSLGNLFSVRAACRQVGMEATITSDQRAILAADAIFLPGVGAFGDAMDHLRRLDLVEPLRDAAARGTPLVGICLGLQLLMSESFEFGHHQGLGLIEGPAVPFEEPQGPAGRLKVPQVGWNTIHPPADRPDAWQGSPLAELEPGSYLYFVHSFYVQPQDPAAWLSVTTYGDVEFCSSIQKGNIYAFQFHPERSGPVGLKIYDRLADIIRKAKPQGDN